MSSIADGWRKLAGALAERTMKFLVNRVDVWGQYLAPSARAKLGSNALTRPPKNRRGHLQLTPELLKKHFRAKAAADIIGLHSTSIDGTSRWCGIDIDAHEGQSVDAETNLRVAMDLLRLLQSYGFKAVLEDSNGKGGFHIWVLFFTPVPTQPLYQFAKNLVSQIDGAQKVEIFPKQGSLGSGSLGNWLRQPGRHWGKSEHWSRFFDGNVWLEGEAAAAYWLNAPLNEPVLLSQNVGSKTRENTPEPSAKIASLDDARALLGRLNSARVEEYTSWLQVGQILHALEPSEEGLAVWDTWSQQSTKYEPGACAAKWAGFDGAKGLTVATLISWANADSPTAPAPRRGRPDPLGELIDIVAGAQVELWHSPNKTGYITLAQGSSREHYPVRSLDFERWLVAAYAGVKGRPPNATVRRCVIDMLDARAVVEGNQYEVYVRVAGLRGVTYVDLATRDRQVVEISQAGWRIIYDPPVRFQRPMGLKPLPIPLAGGTVDELRQYFPACSDDQFILILGAVLSYIRGVGPFPVLVFEGEQGSAKSTVTRLVRAVTDPAAVELGPVPKDGRDLAVQAYNTFVMAFDNVSGLSQEMSDSLCRLSTGGGYRVRELYTSRDETLFTFCRPVVLNGIVILTSRADLRDRAIIIILPPITETDRRTETSYWEGLEQSLPTILGALYTALGSAIASEEQVTLSALPRMADFARLGTAAEAGLGLSKGQFMEVYSRYRDDARREGVEQDPFAAMIRDLAFSREFSGTATALRDLLIARAAGDLATLNEIPRGAQWIVNRLRRVARELPAVGVEVVFGHDKVIHIRADPSCRSRRAEGF